MIPLLILRVAPYHLLRDGTRKKPVARLWS
jgi:hypothetical protein